MPVDISIIIRTYNEEKFISELLDEIAKQETESTFEVILVDSGSTDRTIEIANLYPFVRVVCIPKDEFTFGRALNVGCKSGLGAYFVSISGHCIPNGSRWLDSLIKPILLSEVGYVYGRQIGIDEKRPDHPSTRFSERRIFLAHFPAVNGGVIAAPFMNNANSAFRRELWESYNFDETLTGFEDLDFALHHSRRGIQGAYASDAEVIHLHDENNARVFNRFFREQLALKKIDRKLFDRSATSIIYGFLKDTAIDLVAASRSSGGIRRYYVSIVGYRLAQYYAIYLAQKVQSVSLDSLSETHESFLKWITKGRFSFDNIRLNYGLLISGVKRQ